MKTNFIFSQLKQLLLVICFVYGLGMFAQSEGDNANVETSIAITADDASLIWNPAPEFFPGCSFTILHGDISKPNLDFFFKVNSNTEIINHTHNSAERMVLISGEMEVQYEGEKPQILKSGTYAYGPAKKPHQAKCLDKGECILFIAMVEPFSAEPIMKKD